MRFSGTNMYTIRPAVMYTNALIPDMEDDVSTGKRYLILARGLLTDWSREKEHSRHDDVGELLLVVIADDAEDERGAFPQAADDHDPAIFLECNQLGIS